MFTASIFRHRRNDRVTPRQHRIGHVRSWSVRRWDADQVGIGNVPPGRSWRNGHRICDISFCGYATCGRDAGLAQGVRSMNAAVKEFCFVERCVLFEGWKQDLITWNSVQRWLFTFGMSTQPSALTHHDSLKSGDPLWGPIVCVRCSDKASPCCLNIVINIPHGHRRDPEAHGCIRRRP